MLSYQTEYKKNAGFTLVEIMVVILIISILLLVGNYWDINQRREKARLEELAVEIISMIDQEKVDTLLGKTENGEIVRKREVEIVFNTLDPSIQYTSNIYLAKDDPATWVDWTTKNWTYPLLAMKIYNCDTSPSATDIGETTLTAELTGDTMSFADINTASIKHIVLQLSRLGSYREIHIDRRTGVTYEREGTGTVSCS